MRESIGTSIKRRQKGNKKAMKQRDFNGSHELKEDPTRKVMEGRGNAEKTVIFQWV